MATIVAPKGRQQGQDRDGQKMVLDGSEQGGEGEVIQQI
jgi:hypothetical protein